MEKFNIHTHNSAPEGSKKILENVQKQNGYIPNLYGIMAISPKILEAYNEMGRLFRETSFLEEEKNIIWLTISHTNGCHYCMAIHSMVAEMFKVPVEIVDAIREDAPIKNAKLEALRTFTRLMVEKRGWATDEEVSAFLNAGYTREQIFELIVGIAQKTISNYVNHIADTPLDEKIIPYKWESEIHN